jgi:hypothetical protein
VPLVVKLLTTIYLQPENTRPLPNGISYQELYGWGMCKHQNFEFIKLLLEQNRADPTVIYALSPCPSINIAASYGSASVVQYLH